MDFSENSVSAYSSPEYEDDLTTFFDFDAPQSYIDSSTSSQTGSPLPIQAHISRGCVRVSLACLSCRKRHVKCCAELPGCSRCQEDGKECFYAKSRRSLGDRSSTRRRAITHDTSRGSPSMATASSTPYIKDTTVPRTHPSPQRNHTSDSTSSSYKLSPRSEKSNTPKRLIDLYYSNFQPTHPFILPKFFFLTRHQNDPTSLAHLVPMIQYIGSLYASDISSTSLRHIAMQQVTETSNLPTNGFSVQVLLLAAIVLHTENNVREARKVLHRAILLATGLGMNDVAFADGERDVVLGESWRRTWWGACDLDFVLVSAGYDKVLDLGLPGGYSMDMSVFQDVLGLDFEKGLGSGGMGGMGLGKGLESFEDQMVGIGELGVDLDEVGFESLGDATCWT